MHEKMMEAALTQAKIAYRRGEVPIGCVIARGEEIVTRTRNSKIGDNDSLAHAEIKAIKKAKNGRRASQASRPFFRCLSKQYRSRRGCRRNSEPYQEGHYHADHKDHA